MSNIKKLILFIGAVVLTACSSTSIEAKEMSIFTGGKASNYSVVTDNENGCQYVEVYEYSPSNGRTVAITPRMGPDNKQICIKN